MKKDLNFKGQDKLLPRFSQSVIKIGNSLGLVIPKKIIEENGIEVGDKMIAMLAKRFDYSYKCGICYYEFNSEEEFPECPSCEETHNILVLKEVEQ